MAIIMVIVLSIETAQVPRGSRLWRPLHKLRGLAEKLDRKIDLAGNLRAACHA